MGPSPHAPRGLAVRVAALAGAALAGAGLFAQAPTRLATTADALAASPVFFHGKLVVVRHAYMERDGVVLLEGTSKPVLLFWRERPSRSEGEIRGEFWDLGRLREDDPRFSAYDFSRALHAVNLGRWPAREQVFALINATLVESLPAPTPTLRGIALAPESFEDRRVSVVGRFRGANLYGDVAQPLGKARWDFVVQSADAAVWVSGLRPRGKGFDLNPMARVDTGRWLQITGTVRREGPTVWIQAESVALAAEPEETPVEVQIPITPREPPPEVVFSSPLPGESAVAVDDPVRVQFSRDMDGRSFAGRVHVDYAGAPDAPAEPPLEFTVSYREGPRAIEIRFARPLEPFRDVRVDLREGITARDGTPLPPWTMTFTTGG